MTVTVEIIRDPHTQFLKAYVTQEGQRADTNLLAGRQFTRLDSAMNYTSFELRCRYSFPAGFKIAFYLPIEADRKAAAEKKRNENAS